MVSGKPIKSKFNCLNCGKETDRTNNRQEYCKKCRKKLENKTAKEWNKNNNKRKNKNKRNWRAKNRKEKNTHYTKEKINYKEYKKRNPIKENARYQALKKIKIPKGQKCQKCRKRKATERHHKDYNKPLEVEFLCKKCHKIKDMEMIRK